jgi:hypothetical protein
MSAPKRSSFPHSKDRFIAPVDRIGGFMNMSQRLIPLEKCAVPPLILGKIGGEMVGTGSGARREGR